jgi:dynein heavy chain
MDRDELDSKKVLEKDWDELVNKAFTVRDTLHVEQAEFKKQLIRNIDALIIDVQKFRTEFVEHGPMVPNLEPAEALNRLKNFNEEYSVHARKYHSYFSGETLFGLPHQPYPDLEQTKNELEKLDKLYTLYSKVTDTITKWHECPWTEI